MAALVQPSGVVDAQTMYHNNDIYVPHINLTPFCSICRDIIMLEQQTMVLIGDTDGNQYQSFSKPFAFPHPNDKGRTLGDYFLCRRPSCSHCEKSPECVTLHHACFKVFQEQVDISCDTKEQRYRMYDYLYTQGAWAMPWKGCFVPYIDRKVATMEYFRLTQMHRILPDWENTLLARLPMELLVEIYHLSKTASLWQSVSAACLVSDFKSLHAYTEHHLPLQNVVKWSRKTPAAFVGGGQFMAHNTLLRVKMDAKGIVSINSLETVPIFTKKEKKYDNLVFLLETRCAVKKIEIFFKYGMARLSVPPHKRPLRFWDAKEPLSTAPVHFGPAKLLHRQRFRTLDMEAVIGITWVFARGKLFSIVPHYKTSDCAIEVVSRFPQRNKDRILWIYTPVAQGDEVVSVWSKVSSVPEVNCLVIRRKLSGDTFIGTPNHENLFDAQGFPKPYVPLGKCNGATIIYGDPDAGTHITTFGIHSHNASWDVEQKVPKEHPPCHFFLDAYFSEASLSNLQSATIYYSHDSDICRGVLFAYKNGTQKSVGQCRVNYDRAEQFELPEFVCCRQVTSSPKEPRLKTIMTFSNKDNHDHDGEVWHCRSTHGCSICYWFDCLYSFSVIYETRTRALPTSAYF